MSLAFTEPDWAATGSRTVSLAEAKAHLSALVSAAEAGETITITKHGRPAATINPASSRRTPREAVAAWRAYQEAHPADLSKRDPEFDITDRRTLHIGHRY